MSNRTSLLLAAALAAATAVPARADFQVPRVSPNATVSQTIGTTTLSVKYCRPGVKGRAIWGALVPWDKPWRTGANEITTFTTSDTISVEGRMLPAGTYGIVTIPGAQKWTVVFSRQSDMWGSVDYDPAKDQLRADVMPQAAEPTEWMQFGFDALAPDNCELALRWEKVRVPVRIQVDVTGMMLRAARAAVATASGDAWRTPYRAAAYGFDNGFPNDEVTAWAATALSLKENFNTVALSAKLAQRAGRTKDAVAQMTRAVAMAKAEKDVEAVQIAPLEKLLAEWTAKK